jgi:cobalt/nickel transport system permease protein
VKLDLDEYAHLDSALHRWEPKCKLVGLFILAFAFSFVRDLRLLPAMLGVACAVYVASGLPFSFLTTRLRYPGLFLLVPAVLLPFVSGSTVLLSIGPLALRQEGCLAALLIVTRFVSILTITLVLFGSAPFLTTIKAMLALGLPPILADMTLLAYRYIFQIGGDLERMETAMGLRGFKARRPNAHTLGVLASLSGSLLVRSYEQSERVYNAMALRGYGRSQRSFDGFDRVRSRDAIVFVGVLLVAVSFVGAEVFLRGRGV